MAYNFFSSFNLFRNEFSWEMKTLSTENTESPINFNFNPKQSIAKTISFYCNIYLTGYEFLSNCCAKQVENLCLNAFFWFLPFSIYCFSDVEMMTIPISQFPLFSKKMTLFCIYLSCSEALFREWRFGF